MGRAAHTTVESCNYRPWVRRAVLTLTLLAALVCAPGALADDWLPHPTGATWTYVWSDSAYNPTPTREQVTVKEVSGRKFTLAWTTADQGNPPDAPVSQGTATFEDSMLGLVNVDWSSTAPPSGFPILCPRPSSCGNSLSSSLYNLIWGARTPILAAPLLRGVAWDSTGGVGQDVASSSSYLGTEPVAVPAFQLPVLAAKVRSEITQAGALGDPYGSGIRTVWWVYGVGPVKIVFEHGGGVDAPVTTVVLHSTNQTPKPGPGDRNYFPLKKGLKGTFRWQNDRHLEKPAVQQFAIDEVINSSARLSVKSLSGPIRAAGAYGFTSRLDGVTNIWGVTKAQSLAKLPKLGPRALPVEKRRQFATPIDLMTYGFNPLIPAYPAGGQGWVGKPSGRDYSIYGVTGRAAVLGVQKVKVPAGTFSALAVRTSLKQAGFPFGTGTRTSWFAPGRGLVKLVFRHGDGSTSVVELLR